MKYTKDNIVGITFFGPTDPYVIIAIKENDQVEMAYHPNHLSYTSRIFENSLDVTLKYLNDGTWTVISQENNYQIY